MKSQNWNPGELLELSGAFWQTCVLHAAVKLDVFTAIGDQRLSGETIAKNKSRTCYPVPVLKIFNAYPYNPRMIQA